jgi:CRISPR-associated exonuclease Cas4
MFADHQLLPISALQHLIFCERQCALIHVEQLWAENSLTIEGRQLHEKAHDGRPETRGDVKITRGLWLKSNQLGLIGQADVVEFHKNGTVTPVEYKRGKPKKDDSDRVQICAQAMCLEHMLDVTIDAGQLYYGTRKRRTDVPLDQPLRDITQTTINRLQQMIRNRETPTANRMKKCDKCSLVELCLPDSQRLRRGVAAWNQRQYSAAQQMPFPQTDPFETSSSNGENQ